MATTPTDTTSSFSLSRESPTPPAAPQSTRGSSSAAFSPGASPPLILAFLAIGLFAVSMMGVLGWRRFQFGRFGPPPGARGLTWTLTWDEMGSIREAGQRRTVGPRPKLWDLWTIVINSKDSTRGDQKETGWDLIMPISVTLISDAVTEHRVVEENNNDDDTAIYPISDIHTVSTSGTRHLITSIPVRYHRWPQHHGSTEKATSLLDDVDETGKLQVAVAIAMPSRREGGHGNETGNRNESERGTDDTIEYMFGVYECAWKHGNR